MKDLYEYPLSTNKKTEKKKKKNRYKT